MRVLWLCNIVLPELCDEFGFRKVRVGGWLTGMWQEITKKQELSLAICVPIINKVHMKDGIYKNYNYYSFLWKGETEGLEEQQQRFEEILSQFHPEVIHIWGTEYIHTLSMLMACNKMGLKERTLIHIQGLVSICAIHYMYGLSFSSEDKSNSTCIQEQKSMMERGKFEKQALQIANYVSGRTEWDEACVKQINPNITYVRCGEILREIFNKNIDKWKWGACKKHCIFVSQANYPIKGFHLIIDQIKTLYQKYTDLEIVIAGVNILDLETEYSIYIKKLIKKYELETVLHFVGVLSAEEMYEQYLRANVFLSASAIENSSNSIGEAMCVGIPIVSTYVGGITSMIEHGKSGFLYPLDEPYMMPYYIEKIFESQELAEKISKEAQRRAKAFHGVEKNVNALLNIYKDLA